jgi:nitrogen-specific signal transduction histidine kinase
MGNNGHIKPALKLPQILRSLLGFGRPLSPTRFFWAVAFAIFVAELMIMILLMNAPDMGPLVTAMIDASLLVLLVSPVLFFFLFKPLTAHIAKRMEVEGNLRIHKDMLQTVFDGISDPLVLLDAQLKIKMLNIAAMEYYGVQLEDVINYPCNVVFSNRGMPCNECNISEATKTNQTVALERQSAIDPMGTEQVVIYRSPAKGSNPGDVIIRISDVTDAKNMERQMIQQEKMASLGLLISSVAHEINNPNNMISFNLPILRDYFQSILPIVAASDKKDAAVKHLNMSYQEMEKDAFELMTHIEYGSERITSIVSKLKEFSRINTQKRIENVDVRKIVDKVVAICSGEIKRYISSFNVEIPADFPLIHTNAEYLEQILINLLINACHAADKIDASINVRFFLGETWDRCVIIEVHDNGCGMDEATMARIFDPLFSTKKDRGGTGLGLYVCQNLVRNLGGHLEVESTNGEGTVFRVILTDRERRNTKRKEP